jgi:hypothetical protein
MKRLSLCVAGTLLFVGLAGLVGCIWIPGDYKGFNGAPRPETMIGPTGSDKPLRLLEASRRDVELVLGKPQYDNFDGRRIVYEYHVTTGVLLTVCFGALPMTDARYLRLQFTEDGRLRDFAVFKEVDGALGAMVGVHR